MDRIHERIGAIAFGGDYNPEQWSPQVWDEDIELMNQAGVSMVSVGIFSWAKVEPHPGEYDFGWLDDIMDRLADAGIAVCLATMTASPPPWLAQMYPETLPMRRDGTRLWPGSRQHYCPSSPLYRQHAVRLAGTVARRYAQHPALAMWHINNEYGCHVAECYCDTSAEAFRSWLTDRYGSLDQLNETWATSFWSQHYSDWSQIWPPRTVPTWGNPGQQLDFARFTSDELLACYLAEKEVLREVTPDVPVTTNFFGQVRPTDGFAWAPHLDVISFDSYPDPYDADAPMKAAFHYDLMRGLGDGAGWLLMEQAPSAVNWRPRNAPKAPGIMRLWSWEAVAHGAESVFYFQWRQSQGGAERFHSAMVPHAGRDTRVFQEVNELGNELRQFPGLAGSRQEADVAVVMDWSSWWALEGESHPSSDIIHADTVAAHYRPLYEASVATDVVHPGADLSEYRMVVVPNLYLVDTAHAANLESFVQGGGTMLMSFFSGIVDRNDRVHLGGYPAPFRRLLGLWIEEFWPLEPDTSIALSFTGGLSRLESRSGQLWSEKIHLEGAEPLARFGSGDLNGSPALARHRFGQGEVYYCGTRLDAVTMRQVTDHIRNRAGVSPVLPHLPAGVRARSRVSADGTTYHIVLNHNEHAVNVTVGNDKIALPARGVSVSTDG